MPGYPPRGRRPAGPLVSPPVTEADTLLPDGGEVQTSVDTMWGFRGTEKYLCWSGLGCLYKEVVLELDFEE